MSTGTVRAAAFCLLIFCAGRGEAAEQLPALTKAEREMTEAPGEPSATAVFLIQRGTIHLRNLALQEASSTIKVQARLKILKEEGKSHGEIAIAHGNSVRLKRFEGRTITAQGKVVKVDSRGTFKRKISEIKKREVTAIAFPEVAAGSILEWEYELAFDSFYFVEPWYFMDELPVLRSEVVWEIPNELVSRVWSIPTFGVSIDFKQERGHGYTIARFSASNLPSTPNEVYGLPFRDLAARLMVVPMAYRDRDINFPLLESWAAVCESVDDGYARARRQGEQAARQAALLTRDRAPDEASGILYRFVRDEIKVATGTGPWNVEDATVDKVLAKREGTPAGKALLLQSMLAAVNIPADLVWAGDSREAAIVPELPYPGAFDRVLVRTRPSSGSPQFLDPVDRSLSAGRLSMGYEGTVAVVHDRKAPETIVLPQASFGAHQAHATLVLSIDSEGRVTGRGEAVFRGHAAWEKSFPDRPAGETQEAWQAWADGALPGFKVSDLKAEDDPDQAVIKVSWAMAAMEETVLGDEVTLTPSRPLGPMRQPFTVNETQRRSPVRLDHAGIEDVEVQVVWPEGWSLTATPQSSSLDKGIAAHGVTVTIDQGARSVKTKRYLVIRNREPRDGTEFAALREVFAEAEKSDAQTLVITRP